METIIEVKNLAYQSLWNNFNLKIKKGTFTSIVGANGCGKSTLLKIIMGLVPVDAEIIVDQLPMNKQNKKLIQRKIGVVFENSDANFIAETPREDITFFLHNLGYTEFEIQDRIDEAIKVFSIEEYLDMTTANLSGGEKQLLALATVCAQHPSILILDDAFTMLNGILKEKIMKLLKKMNRIQKITILYVTHDINDVVYGTDILIVHDQTVFLQGKKEKVFLEEKKWKKAEIELPFMASLSLKLQFYELLDTILLDMDKMVDKLWK